MMSTKKGLLIGALSLSLGMLPMISTALFIPNHQMKIRTAQGGTYNPTQSRANFHRNRAADNRSIGRKHLKKARHYLGDANKHIKAARTHQEHAKSDLGHARAHLNAAKTRLNRANSHDRVANHYESK